MKIVFCGGGTGGHITPALAMADILRQNEKSAKFYFIGRKDGKENEAVRWADIPLYELNVSGISRSLSPSNLRSVFRAVKARSEARRILSEIAPDAVIGTGGYVSFPALSAAKSLGIKHAIHESNAYPGLVTRLLGKGCDLVMLGYPEAALHLNKRCKVKITGNPVRSSVGKIGRNYARCALSIPSDKFVVLSFGGSLGAGRINEIMAKIIAMDNTPSRLYIHATGVSEYSKYREIAGNCRIIPYIENMALYLAAADVAITRCGAMTLAEISAAGVPAILIPSPNVTANHQYENAHALATSGAALLIEEKDLTEDLLAKCITRLSINPSEREQMRSALIDRGGKSTSRLILSSIRELIGR